MWGENQPSARKLFDVNEEDKLVFNRNILEEILLVDGIRDKNVFVLSIAGAFRQGKSFILNFFLKYLYTACKTINIVKDEVWLDPKSGFSYRAGSRRHTTGILIWSEVFLIQLSNGEKIAIILIDTQGSFDNVSTLKECTVIFALSTLISSLQIYNLMGNIKGDDLSHLQFFSEYARMIPDGVDFAPPFQNLLFLVRDWQWPHEMPYGAEGGKKLLDYLLDTDQRGKEEIFLERQAIKSAFKHIDCFLLPHPGVYVTTDQNFRGDLRLIDHNFLHYVDKLVQHIFAPENLVPKVINGKKIKVEDFVKLINNYWECFESGKLPEVSSISLANAKFQIQKIVEESKQIYFDEMGPQELNENCLDDEVLANLHKTSKEKAMAHYHGQKKMGGRDLIDYFENQLNDIIENRYWECVQINNKKYEQQNSFKSWLKYVFTSKQVVASVVPVSASVTSVTAAVAEATGLTVAGISAGVVASVGFVLATPVVFFGIAVAGWALWSKKFKKRERRV